MRQPPSPQIITATTTAHHCHHVKLLMMPMCLAVGWCLCVFPGGARRVCRGRVRAVRGHHGAERGQALGNAGGAGGTGRAVGLVTRKSRRGVAGSLFRVAGGS